MSLASSPPAVSRVSVRRGDTGWYVYAIQKSVGVEADGDFGPMTERAVMAFQSAHALFADGVAGPVTQGKVASMVMLSAEGAVPGVPKGLLRGIVSLETGGMLSVVNASVTGGVDCCVVQERVYGPPFSLSALEHAFTPTATVVTAAENLRKRRDAFLTDAWAAGSYERAGKLAAFAHNWPSQGGADYYSVHGHVYNPSGACTWLPAGGVNFPDGTPVKTRQDWAELYAMGGVHGPGQTTKFVTNWG